MAQFTDRFPLNVSGKYYVTDLCTDCDLCRQFAPENIRRDDPIGYSYLFKQPATPDEIALVEEGVAGCPTGAIGSDGDLFDWRVAPIRDWRKLYPDRRDFDTGAPVVNDEA